jgi:hypothetical protein
VPLECGGLGTCFRERCISNCTTLLLAELLLAIVGADETRAESGKGRQSSSPVALRDVRQSDFRQPDVRGIQQGASLRQAVQQTQQDTRKTDSDAAKDALHSPQRAGDDDQRNQAQARLQQQIDLRLQQQADKAAPSAITQLINVVFEAFSGALRSETTELRHETATEQGTVTSFAPPSEPTSEKKTDPAPSSERTTESTPADARDCAAKTTPKAAQAAATNGCYGPSRASVAPAGGPAAQPNPPVPVLRNKDVLPDRNLDTLKPAEPPVPANLYDPTGIRVGNFLYKPALELSAGYDSNPGRRTGGTGSPVVIVAPELSIRSQFERHQLNAEFRGAYTEDTALQNVSHPNAEARVNGRYDLTDTTHLIAEGHYLVDTLVTAGFVKQPLASTLGTTAGVSQQLGAAEITVKGSFDRVAFSNALVANNQPLFTQDRNYTQPGAQVRVSYALTPQFSPFVDLSFDRRNHDLQTDFNGLRRDSTGITGRAGVAVNIGTLTGDVSVGYLSRRFGDSNMQNIGGVVADATLAWAVTDTDTVVLVARSQASETPAVGISGILSRDVIGQLDHQFEPWLIGTLRSGYGQDKFFGTTRIDNRFFVAGGGVYKLSRMVQLKADVSTEWTRSNMPANDFMAVVGLLGVRLQY